MIIRDYIKRACLPGTLLALLLAVSQCQTVEMEQTLLTIIKDIEVKDNQVKIYANRPLQSQAFILTEPLRLIIDIQNADLAANVAKKGEGSGELIKSWSLDQQTITMGTEEETKETVAARLTIALAKNATYQVASETFGLGLKLEEVKKTEEESRPEKMEIPKELYPQIQKLSVSPAGQPTGQAVMPITPGDEKEARQMLNEIAGQTPAGERLPAASLLQNLTYKSQPGTFEAILTGDGEFKNYKLLSLDLPLRIAIDLYGVKSRLGKTVYQVNKDRVRQIRVGSHPNKTRFVIELTGKTIKDARVVSIQKKMVIRIVF